MANLMYKKLGKLLVGSDVEITFEESQGCNSKIEGLITANDYTANLELTDSDGREFILEYSIIRGIKVKQNMETILKNVAVGTYVQITYGAQNGQEQIFRGVVTDNDCEENLEVEADGEELILNYSLIRGFRVTEPETPEKPQKPERAEEPEKPEKPGKSEKNETPEKPQNLVRKLKWLSEKTPFDCLQLSDGKLKELFDRLPREDKLKLNKYYDIFQFGIKATSPEKMTDAALQAKEYLFQEDEDGYFWSEEAVRLCGGMLRRVGKTDPEVYLVGECFREAAVACWREEQYALGGAYAMLTLLEEKPVDAEELGILVAAGVIRGRDISAMGRFYERMEARYALLFSDILDEACTVAGLERTADQTVAGILAALAPTFPGTQMLEELDGWMNAPKAGSEPAPAPDPEPQPQPQIKPQPEPEKKAPAPKIVHGVITRLNWMEHTGTITANNGRKFAFRIEDVSEQSMRRKLENCLRADLDGAFYSVRFNAVGDRASDVRSNPALVEQVRAIFACAERPDRYPAAFQVCLRAVKTSDQRRALGELVRIAIAHKQATDDLSIVKQALEVVEENESSYPLHVYALMDLAQCYEYVGKKTKMVSTANRALEVPGLPVRQKIAVVSLYVRMLRDLYQTNGNRELCTAILGAINGLQRDYSADLDTDATATDTFRRDLLPYRIQAQCVLNMLEEAEADYRTLCDLTGPKSTLTQLIDQTRERLGKTAPSAQEEPETVQEPMEEEIFEEEPEEEFDATPIAPYADPDGWAALHMTKRELVDYAIGISGPDRLAPMMAYLRVGAGLNGEVAKVYRAMALACNDPLESPDYSVESLMNTLSDADYPVLNDYCIGTAFLRASSISGLGYDYSARGLRDSIGIVKRYPALRSAYDILENFRTKAGCAIDIYADYRNKDAKKRQEDMENIIAQAGELYQKFILTPPRDGAKFARLLETKKIVFHKDGDLAVMLRCIMDRDLEALEARKADFISRYLSNSGSIGSMYIRSTAVDDLIVRCWDEAGRSMQMKRFNATLQGDRRNNLRSSINEILGTVRQWYALAEQDASLTWRTEQGAEAYMRLRPALLEQLSELCEVCCAELESCTDPQESTGLFLLDTAARELSARLDGSWKMDQEKYFYTDFLRSSYILLDEDFMPELSSTFCALPDFNVLARIRKHVESEKLSFQEQIDRIYGPDRAYNNYGTAERIIAFLAAQDAHEQVTLPENAAEYVEHTRLQSELSYRSFRENYALAVSCGQIIKSDQFCYTLEDTVRYWYAFCRNTNNYGFFTSILQQVEEQIHESARQYEKQLVEQLEVLLERNSQIFAEYPGSEESIRELISFQNFTVAEDWMGRIRRGEPIVTQTAKPDTLRELDSFWLNYGRIYDRVSNNRRPLFSLIERREVRNKDEKWGRRLIDAWLSNGNPSNSERIGQLLQLLGWQAIRTERFHFAASPQVEIYRVTRDFNAAGLTTPLHPIAEYGSMMERKPMHVVCLYGIYDCDRLYEKMRTLDQLDGSVLILLDYALGQSDRRKLARKMKKRESDMRSKYLVIDRVLVTYLAENCNENVVNRMLIALSAPFSYFQPYVVESADTMPPEIFIGRRDELLKVEQANGVNLIYGGRQLGKSALFKKAVSDIDGRNSQRAVMVDINGLSCAEAARKVSAKLLDMDILRELPADPENWDELCRCIERRLRSGDNEISYLILMLDEADDFIKDCAEIGYRPMVALKDVQQSLPGRFKYVLAGLHDIVKFNRQVALGNNSVITHMSSLKITPFRTEDAKELLTGPLSFLGFSLPSEVTVSQILATCNYFPGLIQLYAKKLIESVRASDYAGYDILRTPPYVVSDEHLRRVMADKEFIAEIHNKFVATLTLDENQDNYYYPLALLIGWMYNVAPSKNGYTAQDVMFHARDLNIGPLVKLDEERIDALLQELQDLNILRLVTENSYLLASKNFRDLLGSDEEIFEKLTKTGGINE